MVGAWFGNAAGADTCTIGAPVATRTHTGTVTCSAVVAVAARAVGTNARALGPIAIRGTVRAGTNSISCPVGIASTPIVSAGAMATARCAVGDWTAVFAERATAAQGTRAETIAGHPVRAGSVAGTDSEVGVWGCRVVAAR